MEGTDANDPETEVSVGCLLFIPQISTGRALTPAAPRTQNVLDTSVARPQQLARRIVLRTFQRKSEKKHSCRVGWPLTSRPPPTPPWLWDICHFSVARRWFNKLCPTVHIIDDIKATVVSEINWISYGVCSHTTKRWRHLSFSMIAPLCGKGPLLQTSPH